MFRLSLQSKAFVALTILLAVMMMMFVGFSRLGLQRGLGPYVAEIELARMDWLADRLQTIYRHNQSWQAIIDQPALWRALRRPPNAWARPEDLDSRANTGFPFFTRSPDFPDIDIRSPKSPQSPTFVAPPTPAPLERPVDGLARRLCLLDAKNLVIAGNEPLPGHARTVLKDSQGRTIGFLVMNPPEGLKREADRAFLEKQFGFVLWTGAAGLLLAMLLSGWLAHRWLKPIGSLVEGARNLAAGRLQTRIREHTDSEEFSRLIHTFNDMAEQLDSMETSRRQWIGDMAHELRTPLAAMRAEIEAVQDGIRQFDDQTAERLHRQLMRLIHLVGDLRDSVDSSTVTPARMENMHPLEQLHEAIASLQTRFEQAGVGLQLREPPEWRQPDNAPLVRGNAQQLHRVFLNLLENSLRYTDRGGYLQVSTTLLRDKSKAQLQIVFEDTSPGVSPQDLPHIFERLYRAESSRQRVNGDLGGSGLGLAICRSIVQQHEGHIEASPSPLGGLRVTLTLPISGES